MLFMTYAWVDHMSRKLQSHIVTADISHWTYSRWDEVQRAAPVRIASSLSHLSLLLRKQSTRTHKKIGPRPQFGFTDNRSKLRDRWNHYSPLPNSNLTKVPLPKNLTLTLMRKLKLFIKLESYSDCGLIFCKIVGFPSVRAQTLTNLMIMPSRFWILVPLSRAPPYFPFFSLPSLNFPIILFRHFNSNWDHTNNSSFPEASSIFCLLKSRSFTIFNDFLAILCGEK